MKKNVSFLRWVLSLMVLSGLFFGAVGQSLARGSMPVPVAQATSCWGDTITQWTFTGNTIAPSYGSGIISAGSGVSAPDFITSGIANPPAVSYSKWNTTAVDETKYIQIALDTSGRQGIGLTFTSNQSGSGPTAFEMRYSIDNWVTNHVIDTRGVITTELSYLYDFSALTDFNNQTNLQIRLYGYGATTSTSTWRFDNITFTGTCITLGNTPTSTLTPTPSPVRSVIISEVAWMGTLASPSLEWIELQNTTSAVIDLTGWTLAAADGSPSIALSGTIPANGYLLLRNNNVFSADVPGAASSLLYSGDLSDSGETLTLKDGSNTVIDTANGNGGAWPAGIATSSSRHGTMERFGTNAETDASWYTSTGPWLYHDFAGNLIHGTPGGTNSSTPTATSTVPSNTPTLTRTPTITPTLTPKKKLVITEVAWMGTAANSSDEWIEIFNPSTTETVDFTGWEIRSFTSLTATPKIIPFTSCPVNIVDQRCKVGPRQYFLLERRQEAVNDIDGDFIYAWSALSNTGEMMLLCDPYSIEEGLCDPRTPDLNNKVIDVVNNYDQGPGTPTPSATTANPWPAGSGSPNYSSMERKSLTSNEDTNWFTHPVGVTPHWGKDASGNAINGTPKHDNWSFTVTATPRATATRTPTATPKALPGPILVINEVLARAGTDWNNDGVLDVGDEFIEVINAGTVNVTLSGYKLDDYELDANGKLISNGFTLTGSTLKPGEKAVFYGAQTGIRLEDAGDTVRLLRGNTIVDAVTYPPAKSLDVSMCRYVDGYGSWIMGCFPTPNQANTLMGSYAASNRPASACALPDSTPLEFVLAECRENGLGIWNPDFWNSFPGEGIPLWQWDERDKWPVIYQ